MNAAAFAHAVSDLAGAAMLLLGLLLPIRQRSAAATRLVAAQGGLLAVAATSAAWGGASGPGLWLLAAGALAGRTLLLPVLFRLAAGEGGSTGVDWRNGDESSPHGGRLARPVPNPAATLLAGGALAVLAVAAVVSAGTGMVSGTRGGLALALATLLAGLLAMLGRRGVPFGLLGLLAAENGALLGLVHAGGALPVAAALAVLSPGLVACVALAAVRGRADTLWATRR